MLKALQNKNVFSWRLKAAWTGVLQSDSDKRFHAAGPAKAKPCSANCLARWPHVNASDVWNVSVNCILWDFLERTGAVTHLPIENERGREKVVSNCNYHYSCYRQTDGRNTAIAKQYQGFKGPQWGNPEWTVMDEKCEHKLGSSCPSSCYYDRVIGEHWIAKLFKIYTQV